MTIRADLMNVVHQALYTQLDAALVEEIYDHVPASEPYPYVVIGDDEPGEEFEASGKILEQVVTVDVYSDAEGQKEVKTIAGTIQNSLTGTALNVAADNFNALPMSHENTGFTIEPNSAMVRIHHATLSFRFLIQDIT